MWSLWFVLAAVAADRVLASNIPYTYCPLYSKDVVRIRAFSIEQLKRLKQLITDYPNLHIKPWIQPTGADTPALYMAPTDVADYLVAQARHWGMDASVITHDIQRNMLDRRDPLRYSEPYRYAYVDPSRNRTPFYNRGQGPENFRLDEFHPLEEIYAFMDSLKAKYPKLCSVESIGKSYNGREMFMLKIGASPNGTKGIFIDATMHAREWIATSTSLYFAAQLLTNYDRRADIRSLVDNIDWYIVPVVNVDGYEYTWTLDRNWRRSRSKPEPCIGAECRCRGADLNRNWDSNWNTTDACWHPCCNTFPGTRPMSEPEVENVANKLLALENRTQAYISLHSYGQLWMYPYGHKEGEYTKDVADLHEVAELAVEAVQKVRGTQYKAGSVAEVLYEFSGGSQDWVRDHTNIKYSYLVELRPPGFDGQHSGHFCVDPSQILPTAEEIFEGVKVVAKTVQGKLKLTGKAWKKKQRGSSDTANTNMVSLEFLIWTSIFYVMAQWMRYE